MLAKEFVATDRWSESVKVVKYSAPEFIIGVPTAPTRQPKLLPLIFGPNISGSVCTAHGGFWSGTGAFYQASEDNSMWVARVDSEAASGYAPGSPHYDIHALNATRSSSVYGSSSTVQSPARQALMIIRA